MNGKTGNCMIILLAITLVLAGCRYDTLDPVAVSNTGEMKVDVPPHFPPITYPEGNRPTAARVDLGKSLFFDTRLSSDGLVSCASCHLPEHAFADVETLSIGVEGRLGMRNAPSLANVAWQPRLFMDGGVPTLELQVLAPLDNIDEHNLHILEVVDLLASDELLQQMSMAAYERALDPYVITRAIAAFERTLISGNSAYDRYLQGETNAISEAAKAGEHLFFSEEVGCGNCHSGVLLSDFSYQNIGLYEEYQDEGRAKVTSLSEDIGKFKVPGLRNVASTAPYMHDGSLPDLLSVVNHFDHGGEDHPLKHPAVKPLNLSESEKYELIAFMEALSDPDFITNAEHRP